jgi:hypothetical protein
MLPQWSWKRWSLLELSLVQTVDTVQCCAEVGGKGIGGTHCEIVRTLQLGYQRIGNWKLTIFSVFV